MFLSVSRRHPRQSSPLYAFRSSVAVLSIAVESAKAEAVRCVGVSLQRHAVMVCGAWVPFR